MVWTSQDKGLAPGAVLLSGAVEALDGGARMPTTEPFTMGAELEAGQIRVLPDGVPGNHELVYVHAVDLG